jgi:hypothetical protein
MDGEYPFIKATKPDGTKYTINLPIEKKRSSYLKRCVTLTLTHFTFPTCYSLLATRYFSLKLGDRFSRTKRDTTRDYVKLKVLKTIPNQDVSTPFLAAG